MSNIKSYGPLKHRISSFFHLSGAAFSTYFHRAMGRKMEPSWDAHSEIGIRFWRKQFTRAMKQTDMNVGRKIFNSLCTETGDIYDVSIERKNDTAGTWFTPKEIKSRATLLYYHGGGYTFDGPVSERFAAMLCHHIGARLFKPDYRLTPEHAHPAQLDDGMKAWKYLSSEVPAENIIIIGDSAGGHLSLMMLQKLKEQNLDQPLLCIGLCPWTDIGDRGKSLHENDRYDFVQGWMALKFGEWLDPKGVFGREALSPIFQDYSGLAPIYMQAGGREILHDMIADFADVQAGKSASILFDDWPDMPHDFQAYDSMKQSSTAALNRIKQVVHAFSDGGEAVTPCNATRIVSGSFDLR